MYTRRVIIDYCGNVLIFRQLSGSEAKLEELHQRVKVMDDALKGNAMSTNALENAKKNLEAKVKMYEDKIPHLENNLVTDDFYHCSIHIIVLGGGGMV